MTTSGISCTDSHIARKATPLPTCFELDFCDGWKANVKNNNNNNNNEVIYTALLYLYTHSVRFDKDQWAIKSSYRNTCVQSNTHPHRTNKNRVGCGDPICVWIFHLIRILNECDTNNVSTQEAFQLCFSPVCLTCLTEQ